MGDHGWPHFWDLYHRGVWEPETKALLGRHLRPGSLFVDVGAWIGPVTLWALELGADVIAIEPDPVAREELCRQAPSTVEIWPGAIATTSGTARLAANPKDGGEYGDSMSRLAVEGHEVATWTLPDVLAGRIPDLVKIDVEGYEIDLCPSLMPWLAERRVPVQVSCHGAIPALHAFSGYSNVAVPDDLWGDLIALPERNPA